MVSNQIFDRNDVPNENITLMFVAFGQYLDHDLDHVPVYKGRFKGNKVLLIDNLNFTP